MTPRSEKLAGIYRNKKSNKDVKIIAVTNDQKNFQTEYISTGFQCWYAVRDFERLFIKIT